MRDSWIDKKELEELVGEFSSAKGKSRRSGLAPGRREASDAPGPGGVDSPEQIEVREGTELVKSGTAPKAKVEKRSILHDTDRLERGDLEQVGLVPSEDDATSVSEPIAGPAEENGKRAFSSPELPVFEFEFFGLDSERDATKESSIEEPKEDLLEGTSFEPVSRAATTDESVVSNLTVEVPSVEGHYSRRIPTFLRETAELPEARQLPASARDTDRAINALAGARSMVDEGRLLQVLPQGDAASGVSQIETQGEKEDALVFAPSESDKGRRINPEAGLLLHARLEDFGDSLQRVIGASEVAVCDADGFLLYQSSGFNTDGALHHSLLLQVSGRLNTLLRLGKKDVSQLTDGNGAWHCLISGNGRQGDLFAGFSLPEPLEQKEVDVWKNALSETITPVRRDY